MSAPDGIYGIYRAPFCTSVGLWQFAGAIVYHELMKNDEWQMGRAAFRVLKEMEERRYGDASAREARRGWRAPNAWRVTRAAHCCAGTASRFSNNWSGGRRKKGEGCGAFFTPDQQE